MDIAISITSEPIESLPAPHAPDGCATGAVASFIGLVRDEENGGHISALVYEAYQPMAENVMRTILAELSRSHPCQRVDVVHRVGTIAVGQAAIRIHVFSRHRSEAFALLAGFMDRLKQDVPIWKTEALP